MTFHHAFSRSVLRPGLFAGIAAIGVATISPAHAASSFSALADGLLTIDDVTALGGASVSELTISGFTDDFDSGSTGGASLSGTAEFLGDSLDQEASVAGSVASPPTGETSSFYFTSGGLTLTNTSSSAFEVLFGFTYELSTSATADDDTVEDAFATATVLLEETGSSDAILDEMLVADVALGEPGGAIGPTSLQFIRTIEAGQTLDLFLTVDAEGNAASMDSGAAGVVPVPAALPLMASALGLLGIFGVRRKKA